MKVKNAKLDFELGNYQYTALNSDPNPQDDSQNANVYSGMQKYPGFQQYEPVSFAPKLEEIAKEKEEPEVKYIIHKVEFTDTMEGLALQYNVSAREIRIFNGLTTNDIYYLKELKIPNPDLQNLHVAETDFDMEEFRKKQKIKTLKEIMDKDDHKAAQFYLEENDWDVNIAIDHYKKDLEFEKKYQNKTDNNNKPKQNKYQERELKEKK